MEHIRRFGRHQLEGEGGVFMKHAIIMVIGCMFLVLLSNFVQAETDYVKEFEGIYSICIDVDVVAPSNMIAKNEIEQLIKEIIYTNLRTKLPDTIAIIKQFDRENDGAISCKIIVGEISTTSYYGYVDIKFERIAQLVYNDHMIHANVYNDSLILTGNKDLKGHLKRSVESLLQNLIATLRESRPDLQ